MKTHPRNTVIALILVMTLNYGGWAIALTEAVDQPKTFLSLTLLGMMLLIFSPLIPGLLEQDLKQWDWIQTLPTSWKKHQLSNTKGAFLCLCPLALESALWASSRIGQGLITSTVALGLIFCTFFLRKVLRKSFIPAFISVVLLFSLLGEALTDKLR